jgi:hypothetical protein
MSNIVRLASLVRAELLGLEHEWDKLDSQGGMESEQKSIAERMVLLQEELNLAVHREERTITGEG